MKDVLRLDTASTGSNAPTLLHAPQQLGAMALMAHAASDSRQDRVSVSATARSMGQRAAASAPGASPRRLAMLQARMGQDSLGFDAHAIAEKMMLDVSDV